MPSSSLHGKRVVVGVSGGIAAYKAVELIRRLVDAGAHVAPVMTNAARRFVGETTLSALASEPVRTSLFDDADPIPHTKLGQSADLVIVAPATAKSIAAYAMGLSGDLLTATLLATRAPVIVCPAMHTEMWEHPAVQANLTTLRDRGVHVVDAEAGRLAGGDVGHGRLASPARIVAEAGRVLGSGDLSGTKILITAGGTHEPIDPVRVITNRSSGKQGFALAEAAWERGATVTLVSTVEREAPFGVDVISVETAAQMQVAVMARSAESDVVIMATAVADFRPASAADHKIKKGEGLDALALERTHDFLVDLGQDKAPGQLIVGFTAETADLEENARAKLTAKNLDLIVANNVADEGVGFAHDTNAVSILTPTAQTVVPMASKLDIAHAILDVIVQERGNHP